MPALGLAWSCMTTTRLMLSRTDEVLQVTPMGQQIKGHQHVTNEVGSYVRHAVTLKALTIDHTQS